MRKIIAKLDEQARSRLEEFYAYGGCDLLALALHDETGYPIRAVVDDDTYSHMWVQLPDGRALDVWGARPEQQIEQAWIIDDNPEGEIETVSRDWVMAHLPAEQRIGLAQKLPKALADFKRLGVVI